MSWIRAGEVQGQMVVTCLDVTKPDYSRVAAIQPQRPFQGPDVASSYSLPTTYKGTQAKVDKCPVESFAHGLTMRLDSIHH